MLQRIPPCITLHRNLVLRHSSTKRKHMYVSYTKGQANEHSLICSRRPCQVSLQLSSCDIAVVLSSIQNLKDPDDTAPFSSLGPALLQMILRSILVSSKPFSCTANFARGGRLSKPQILASRVTGPYRGHHRLPLCARGGISSPRHIYR